MTGSAAAEGHGREEGVIPYKLFVGNLSFETSQGELEALFSEVGQLVEVFLPSDRTTGRPRGFAFVEFSEETAAAAAIEKFNGFQLNGRALRVDRAQERARRPGFAGDGPPGAGPSGQRRPRPKGSRRNIRGSKRSL